MTAALLTSLGTGSEVHLWLQHLALDAEPSAAEASALSVNERARAGHFLRDVDRRRFIYRHLHLREVLARYLGITPGDVLLDATLHRPPCLTGGDHAADLSFSLSSSADRSAVAVAWRRSVGVDIERIDPAAANDAVARTVFSTREREVLASVSDVERQALFFHIWARKEAFVKAKGTGLTGNLMSFDVMRPDCPNGSRGEALVTDRETEPGDRPWLVRDVHGPIDFALACCAKGDDWSIIGQGDEA